MEIVTPFLLLGLVGSSYDSTAMAMSSVPPPPPPGQSVTAKSALVAFRREAISCSNQTVRPSYAQDPNSIALRAYSARNFRKAAADIGHIVVSFDIDTKGRPINISAHSQTGKELPARLINSDIIPAVATWAFGEESGRIDCKVTFALDIKSIDAANQQDLYKFRALSLTQDKTLKRQISRSMLPEDSNCYKRPRPNRLVRHRPDFEAISSRPGELSYTYYTHDIDAKGNVVDVKLIKSSGNKAFDDATAAALGKNTYSTVSDPSRTGCYHFYRKAPKSPIDHPKPGNDSSNSETCEGLPDNWKIKPRITYPKHFKRRKIEGWAVMKFDVAPWGAVGNVSVESAQPSKAMANYIATSFGRAKKPQSEKGYSNCRETVKFVFRDKAAKQSVSTLD